MRQVDITPATPISQEEEVPLQANFIDENFDINVEGLNETMKVIHEPMKIYLETTHNVCQTILLLVMVARTNLTLR